MMGSGKSTVGRLLAQITGWPYYDNDELLAHGRGMNARELLSAQGEPELRAAEAEALLNGLRASKSCIVSGAAGTILDGTVRKALVNDSIAVWLTAGPRTLARRARGAAHRPWLDSDASAWMTATLAERAPLYAQVAQLTVKTERRQPAAVAADIAAWLEDRCS
jgi:shikimate kinase